MEKSGLFFLSWSHIHDSFWFTSIKSKFVSVGQQLIWNNIRQIWLFAAIDSRFYGALTHKKLLKQQLHTIILFFKLFIYNPPIINVFAILFFPGIVACICFVWNKCIFAILLSIMLLVNIFDSVNKKGEENCVLSFQNTVLCHKEAINYCEQKGHYDKYINTVFLMIFIHI